MKTLRIQKKPLLVHSKFICVTKIPFYCSVLLMLNTYWNLMRCKFYLLAMVLNKDGKRDCFDI